MTTVLAVKSGQKVAMGADGQVTLGSTVVKHEADKLRRLAGGRVLVGFAGGAADALALLERFEATLKRYPGQLAKAAVELAREWRSDKILRRLESVLVAANQEQILLLSGNGEVIEPDDAVVGIGSGGPYAVAAARALILHSSLTCEEVVRESLKIAAGLCIYTNERIRVEVLE